ncbi:hypothetical protein DPMN_155892 [Dreissena polymorpha]|uniref:Uncharacterized protein n=1 Tax=Dreissena polymorpha TaxID=45954 RepID=A0A9D4JAC0_DREPO|nr:hypothetical protein DPMN_155892 [Dreissena polymorpha]
MGLWLSSSISFGLVDGFVAQFLHIIQACGRVFRLVPPYLWLSSSISFGLVDGFVA